MVHEVSMEKFGRVDLVLADYDEATGTVREFVSIELQAVDLNGSVFPAYKRLLANLPVVEAKFGVNWGNVRKRYIEQLVSKSFYHHQWGTRMVAVMQSPLYERLHDHIQFDELASSQNSTADIIFLLYDFAKTLDDNGNFVLEFDRAVGTSHSSLMTHTLYQSTPPKQDFINRILERL